MAVPPSIDQHLDSLPAMLNLILVQTGKLLRDPELHNPLYAGLAQRRINEFVPAANERFHEALNEIEFEILDAKAVMERDMSIIRKKRAERDRLAGRLPPTPEKKEEEVTIEELPKADEEHDVPSAQDLKNIDAVMVDTQGLLDDPVNQEINIDDISKALQDDSSANILDGMPSELQGGESHIEAMNNIVIPDVGLQGENGQSTDLARENDPFDFESMFASTDIPQGDSGLGMSFDFSSDSMNNPLNETTMAPLDLGSAGANNIPPTNEDINSLLPGLENHLNAPSDGPANIAIVPNGGIANDTAISMPAPGQSGKESTVDGALANVGQPNANDSGLDTSFDDLFNDVGLNADLDNMEGTQKDNAGSVIETQLGEFGEFDESWFT